MTANGGLISTADRTDNRMTLNGSKNRRHCRVIAFVLKDLRFFQIQSQSKRKLRFNYDISELEIGLSARFAVR